MSRTPLLPSSTDDSSTYTTAFAAGDGVTGTGAAPAAAPLGYDPAAEAELTKKVVAAAGNRETTLSTGIPRWLWWVTTPTGVAANLFDILFAFFLFYSIRGALMTQDPITGGNKGAIYNWLKQMGVGDGVLSLLLETIVPLFSTPAIVLNTVGDVVATTPVQDIWGILTGAENLDDMIRTFGSKKLPGKQLNWFQRNMPHIFLWSNRALALTLNFSVLSLADGVAAADLGSGKAALIAVSAMGVVLGDTYYIILNDAKFKRHAVEICVPLFQKDPYFLRKIVLSPAKALETFIEIGSNVFYRGVLASYTVYALGNELAMRFTGAPYTFDGNAKWAVILPGAVTGLTTFCSRLLAITDKMYPDKERSLPSLTQLPRGKSIADIVLASIYALSVGYLVYEPMGGGLRASVPVALLLFSHSVYTNLRVNLEKKAKELEEQASPPEKSEKTLATMNSSELFDLIVNKKSAEWTQDIVPTIKQAWATSYLRFAGECIRALLFRPIPINVGARIARQIAFFAFVDTIVNEFLKGDLKVDLGFDPTAVIAAACAAGRSIAANDFEFMRGGYEAALAHYGTQAGVRQYAREQGRGLQCLPGTVLPACSFFWAKADYDPAQLEAYARSLGISDPKLVEPSPDHEPPAGTGGSASDGPNGAPALQ